MPPPWVACVSACGLRDQQEVSPQNRSLVLVEQLWVLVEQLWVLVEQLWVLVGQPACVLLLPYDVHCYEQ